MTPADGSDFPPAKSPARFLPPTRAILLHGGRALLLFEGAETAPPRVGELVRAGGSSSWVAECWQAEGAWHGVAVLEGVPATEGEIVGADCRWRLASVPELDVAPDPLADLVRRTHGHARDVFAFLVKHLLTGVHPESAEANAHRAFARNFITAAAERDGFIEIVAAPESGGLFAQGWSMSLVTGQTMLAGAAEDLTLVDVEVAQFERDDILPPGQGFCIFGKFWSEESLSTLEAVFFEKDGRLLRLDAVRETVLMTGEGAVAHLLHMLPRLRAPEPTLGAFRRVCRPCFAGEDTLSQTAAPIAAALDAVLQAPDGGMLAMGWLLDPLHRVERVLLKSTANAYARLDDVWCALPRPDLSRGFAQDPRFANLLDERDAMHGFVAHAPARLDQVRGAELYLELVLDDGSCLFRPIAATPFESGERLPQVLNTLSPVEPERTRMIEDHLAPFLAGVPPLPPRMRRGSMSRPIALGGECGGRETVAVVPFRTFAELQPMLALLAGTPEARLMELKLVTTRGVASETLDRLGKAFDFFGLSGGLLIVPDNLAVAAQLDLGLASSAAERVLAWMPSALPKGPGWLGRLIDEADRLPVPGLLSPALTYEDGSISFGGEIRDPRLACALSGYGTAWLHRGAPKRTPAGAAEIALIEKKALGAAGGFSGRLFGDGHAHLDLADRLAAAGLATWCSGSVEFWLLDDHTTDEATPMHQMIRAIDAALLAQRGRTDEERAA